ncbi:hypothetical protein [Alloyangia pacifica]
MSATAGEKMTASVVSVVRKAAESSAPLFDKWGPCPRVETST